MTTVIEANLNKTTLDVLILKWFPRFVGHEHRIVQMAKLDKHIKIGLMDDQPEWILLLRPVDSFQNEINDCRYKFLVKFLQTRMYKPSVVP